MGSFGRHPQNKAHPTMLLCLSQSLSIDLLLVQQPFSFHLTSQILLSRLCCNLSGFNVKIFPNHRSSRTPFSRYFNRFFVFCVEFVNVIRSLCGKNLLEQNGERNETREWKLEEEEGDEKGEGN